MSMEMNEYKKVKELGSGSFGNVWLVTHKDSAEKLAMKMIRMDSLKAKDRDGALNEIRLLASIESVNVVSYRTAFFDSKTNNLCIVMEFAEGGDLSSMVRKKKEKRSSFAENFVWQVGFDVLRGLRVLHRHRILHRDIKPANIFLSQGVAKLGDMNISKVMDGSFATTQTGTPYYTSPEIWANQPYTMTCDIWSLGCVLYELASFRPPFTANDFPDLIAKINKGQYIPLPTLYSKKLADVIRACLTVNPADRPTAEALLSLDIFKYMEKTSGEAGDVNLLQPIKCPTLLYLIDHQLPKSKTKKKIPSKNYSRSKDYIKPEIANSSNPTALDSPNSCALKSFKPRVFDSPKPHALGAHKPRPFNTHKPSALDSPKPHALDAHKQTPSSHCYDLPKHILSPTKNYIKFSDAKPPLQFLDVKPSFDYNKAIPDVKPFSEYNNEDIDLIPFISVNANPPSQLNMSPFSPLNLNPSSPLNMSPFSPLNERKFEINVKERTVPSKDKSDAKINELETDCKNREQMSPKSLAKPQSKGDSCSEMELKYKGNYLLKYNNKSEKSPNRQNNSSQHSRRNDDFKQHSKEKYPFTSITTTKTGEGIILNERLV